MPRGDCYEAAVGFLMDLRVGGRAGSLDEVTLVHGLVSGRSGGIEGVRHGHGWIEIGDTVFDYSNDRETELPREVYYALGNIEEDETVRYSFEEARTTMMEAGTYGPWDELFEDYP